ncbi:mannitol-1-phosphate 5-dehydrogenase [Suicoccus acidiformans]|uniref:Mannitol-1-phosphate 5-dehydrogenase n=1 Tax=Suicoccus acidiformans TaxID=2036206 RepID=A0A347WND8_9LACT|nr:mannitol-1-phosphate 5-dehydrogenase [Suicoccus acidiformans]AXY26595.1 mannitol-1-phosphate 5-dehydrogenase [Suicoccus acidiformans]
MRAVHFGAGNIGRGFIGEVLNQNDFAITFVDLNEHVIDALQERGEYVIELAEQAKTQIKVSNVTGINNGQDPEAVVQAIREADILTTAIGPNILPHIAGLIADGIQARLQAKKETSMDMIACENMIGGSQFLKEEVYKHLSEDAKAYAEEYIGFPNAAVDRIVPIQSHEDPLFVSVEPFKEWVIDQTQLKGTHIHLNDVLYVEDLEPYIERKLFSVNTGHATVAYKGYYEGFTTIDEALEDKGVHAQLEAVLNETGALLEAKWGFEHEAHQAYIQKIISRFQNPNISDEVTRVARTPIRKLGYDERFIRPLREAKAHELTYNALLDTIGLIFQYDYAEDEQAQALQTKLQEQGATATIVEVTGLTDAGLISEIEAAIAKYAK